MTGDHFCQKIVRQVPQYLCEGAYCQIVCNWAHLKGETWQDRLARWFEGTGCDVWVMCTDTRSPSAYTLFWNQGTERQAGFAQRYKDWMAYYKRERIEAISMGLITMRRSSGHSNWFRAEAAPRKVLGSLGDDIARRFELFDFLEATREDRELLNARLHFAPDLRLEQQYEPSAQGLRMTVRRLFRTSGLCYSGDVDADTADLVFSCNGQQRVGDLLFSLAARRDVKPETIARPCLAIVRRLIGRGFLVPASTEVLKNEQVHFQPEFEKAR